MDIKLSCNHIEYYSSCKYLSEFDQKRCEECVDKLLQSIFEVNTIVRLVDLLQNDNEFAKSAAARAIRNATCRGTPDEIKYENSFLY
ncbi:hypothetical protein V6N13_014430 [Hibiscus sabdariffa]|uniref:Uncharacterized protein n=1 Tax=Hibiscus sabdariffa TaxID=183260 RepID=A0ABR2RV93_9ROSI